MYVRKKKVKNWYYYYLVKSVRQGNKVVQEHIKYLGKTGDMTFPKYKVEYTNKTATYFNYSILNEKNEIVYNGRVPNAAFYELRVDEELKRLYVRDFIERCFDMNQSIQSLEYNKMITLRDDFLDIDAHYKSSYNRYTRTIEGCEAINKPLRLASENIREGTKEDIKRLDKLSKLFALENDKVFFRGASSKFSKNLQIGDTFTDKGFGSVSSSNKVAFRYTRGTFYSIQAKKGQNFVPGNSGEYEYILPRNTTYRVIGKKKTVFQGKTFWYTLLEIV